MMEKTKSLCFAYRLKNLMLAETEDYIEERKKYL